MQLFTYTVYIVHSHSWGVLQAGDFSTSEHWEPLDFVTDSSIEQGALCLYVSSSTPLSGICISGRVITDRTPDPTYICSIVNAYSLF